jgi:hypothetical protein
LPIWRAFRGLAKLLFDRRHALPAPGTSSGAAGTSELDPGEESNERAFRAAAARVLAGALALRLIEEDVLPADGAELEWGIEHAFHPIAHNDPRSRTTIAPSPVLAHENRSATARRAV